MKMPLRLISQGESISYIMHDYTTDISYIMYDYTSDIPDAFYVKLICHLRNEQLPSTGYLSIYCVANGFMGLRHTGCKVPRIGMPLTKCSVTYERQCHIMATLPSVTTKRCTLKCKVCFLLATWTTSARLSASWISKYCPYPYDGVIAGLNDWLSSSKPEREKPSSSCPNTFHLS